MSEERVIRRLAAILASDVVGYSAMMSRDEAGTLEALKQHRTEVFDPIVAQHRGRIIKLMGDGALVEFTSAVDALNCAVDIQKAISAQAGDGQPQIALRIGINLGDVIIDGNDVYGNGVNLAARLEPLASPGGICISSIVRDSVGGRSTVQFSDGGKVEVKNIDDPVRIWHWQSDGTNTEAPNKTSNGPSAPKAEASSVASVAVLPFDNMSGDAEQEYFSDGISEDIITDLSKVSGLTVIARNSSFAYKGQAIDLRTVGQELGVATVLEGSVRKAGNRVRITAQLINAEDGSHLWADRYDRDLTDIFAVQDEVTLNIVDALKVTLQPGEKEKITNLDTASTEAHDAYMRGRNILLAANINGDMFHQAAAHCKRALELDPEYGLAYAALTILHLYNFQNRFTDDPETSFALARDYAARAVELAPDEPMTHQAQAYAAQMSGDLDLVKSSVDRALELDPNAALSLMSRGSYKIFEGHPEEALDDLEKAMRLDPSFAHQYLHFLGLAHFFMGNYETALLLFSERLFLARDTDSGRMHLASTLGYLGKGEEAREVWRELCELHPDFSYRERLSTQPYQDPTYKPKIIEGLRRAGIED